MFEKRKKMFKEEAKAYNAQGVAGEGLGAQNAKIRAQCGIAEGGRRGGGEGGGLQRERGFSKVQPH